MKKRYTLPDAIIRHIFKVPYNNVAAEPNDGAGGHAITQALSGITAYEIIAIPPHKSGEADRWFGTTLTLAQRVACGFPHVATYTRGGVTYSKKSMFPGNLAMAELIKTIERAMTSCNRAHTYNKNCHVNASSGRRNAAGGVAKELVPPEDFRRNLSELRYTEEGVNGTYVRGRANGIVVLGQLAGGGGQLTSVFPSTTGYIRKPGRW